jgi:hypothetical protein
VNLDDSADGVALGLRRVDVSISSIEPATSIPICASSAFATAPAATVMAV